MFEQAQDGSEWFKRALLLEDSCAVPGQDDAVPLAVPGFKHGERGAWIRDAGAPTLPASGVRQCGRSLGVPGPACG